MPVQFARREFLAGMVALTAAEAAAGVAPVSRFKAAGPNPDDSNSPFRVSVINDEISQDFGHACEVASQEFGMRWIELRGMWKKNILKLDDQEVAEARRILEKYQLKVTDIASPLFKVDWPGAPKSKFSEAKSFGADFRLSDQDDVLERAMELAKAFQTDRVRCFDFWRLEDQKPYRAAINDKLRDAAAKAEKKGIILLLENEPACNTATAAESVKVLSAVRSPAFMLNWDPGNAATHGEIPYPDGYHLLPKERIGHCHCKDAVKKGNDYDWAPMGGGVIDWAGQFKALKRDGYHYAVSLETHWSGGGTPEQCSRKSWAGMKQLLQQADAL
jgi:L-ribulose-5-phosphate 3-epimerase